MTKKTVEQTDAPSVLLDAHGNPSLVTAGELIESAWGNSVASRVVYRFPNVAAINAAGLAAGTFAIALDTKVVWMRGDTAWVPTALANRVAFRGVGQGTGQQVGSAVVSSMVWAEAFDPFNVFVGSTFTVPTQWSGRWVFDWSVEFSGPGGGIRLAQLTTTTGVYGHTTVETGTHAFPCQMSGSASVLMTEGQTARVDLYHDKGSIITCNTSTDEYFQGYYAGPN